MQKYYVLNVTLSREKGRDTFVSRWRESETYFHQHDTHPFTLKGAERFVSNYKTVRWFGKYMRETGNVRRCEFRIIKAPKERKCLNDKYIPLYHRDKEACYVVSDISPNHDKRHVVIRNANTRDQYIDLSTERATEFTLEKARLLIKQYKQEARALGIDKPQLVIEKA